MDSSSSDSEPESSEASPTPQTPTDKVHHQHQDHDASPEFPSLPASPSFSLHSLGMSPFSPMRQRFAAPLTRSSSSPHSDMAHSEEDNEDLTQDSKDVLVQRLNDIAASLSRQDHIRDDSVSRMHAKVDELENTLSTYGHPRMSRSPRTKPPNLDLRISGGRPNTSWTPLKLGASLSDVSNMSSPPQFSSSVKTGDYSRDMETNHALPSTVSPAEANKLAEEAQALNTALENVIANLQARQEETQHIHELLIDRTEKAAQHIIYLEDRIRTADREQHQGELEILNLQIGLKQIEVQAMRYVPKGADPELRESIAQWKAEWATLKRRRAKMKAERSNVRLASSDNEATPIRRPNGSHDRMTTLPS
ncbi:hypothetical protein F5Y15DRAFT_186686 [Xylariaceae sp. FL0016]|nr:hypothetical protein F5Y15DRAFT_186686 [Xylariaceae sp. FL0016]